MSDDTTDIRARLEAMEQSLRRTKSAVFAVGLISALGFSTPWLVGAAAKPNVIRAAEFDVVDGDGRTRATLGMKGGAAWLTLFDEAGTTTVDLSEGAETPPPNEHAKGLIHLPPYLRLFDPLRKGGAYLDAGSGARLELWNAGHPGVVLLTEQPPDSNRTRAWLALYNGDRAAAWLVTNIGLTALDLWDEAGRLRAIIGNTDLNNAVLDKAPGLPAHRAESSLVLLGPDGKLVWQSP